jgi:hypothetical protein
MKGVGIPFGAAVAPPADEPAPDAGDGVVIGTGVRSGTGVAPGTPGARVELGVFWGTGARGTGTVDWTCASTDSGTLAVTRASDTAIRAIVEYINPITLS